jgi:glycosyltransferase involved in cell wall biosynthesis
MHRETRRRVRKSISKLSLHLRENGLRKTARDLPALARRRLGLPKRPRRPAVPAPERPAEAGERPAAIEATRRYVWVAEPEEERRKNRDVMREKPFGAPLVSVIIPCYNQAHFLSDAIESVLSQTYPYFEVIVVDDGSPDNTSEVAARYPSVKCVRQENRGLAGARNGGLPHARGDFLLFLDSDDRLMPDALETNLRYFDAHPGCGLVCGQQRVIAEDGSLLKVLRRPLIGGDLYATLLARSHPLIPGSVMFRRAAFDSVKPYDSAVNGAADYELYFRIARRYPTYWHDEVVLEYRRHGSNMTTTKAANMLADTVEVLRAQRPFIEGNERYLKAYRAGMLKGQETYGIPLAEMTREQIRAGKWSDAVRNMYILRRYYPKGLTLLTGDRLERQKLLRRLRNRREQLEEAEMGLREREERLQALQREVEQERKRVEHIRGSVEHLTRQLGKGS